MRSSQVSGGPAVGRRRHMKKTLARRVVQTALSLHTSRSEELKPGEVLHVQVELSEVLAWHSDDEEVAKSLRFA